MSKPPAPAPSDVLTRQQVLDAFDALLPNETVGTMEDTDQQNTLNYLLDHDAALRAEVAAMREHDCHTEELQAEVEELRRWKGAHKDQQGQIVDLEAEVDEAAKWKRIADDVFNAYVQRDREKARADKLQEEVDRLRKELGR